MVFNYARIFAMTASVLHPKSVYFDKEKATCLLAIDETSISLTGLHQKALGQGFEKKKEFHITVIGFQTGAKILEALTKHPDKGSALAAIETLAKETDWSFSTKDGVYQVAKTTLFQTAHMNIVKRFSKHLLCLL